MCVCWGAVCVWPVQRPKDGNSQVCSSVLRLSEVETEMEQETEQKD